MEANFWKFDHSEIFPGVTRDPTKNLGPIGSAVLTFIGYKQTNKRQNKQTDRQAKFIYRRQDKSPNSLQKNQFSKMKKRTHSRGFRYKRHLTNFRYALYRGTQCCLETYPNKVDQLNFIPKLKYFRGSTEFPNHKLWPDVLFILTHKQQLLLFVRSNFM